MDSQVRVIGSRSGGRSLAPSVVEVERRGRWITHSIWATRNGAESAAAILRDDLKHR